MVDDYSELGFETRAIHAGQKPDPRTGAVIVPIYQTSTYAQDGVGGTREGDYEYSRTANPTRSALEEALASLEGGRHALAYASGMAASDVVLRSTLRPGDHLVLGNDAYGGTFRLIDKVLSLWGVEHTVADLANLDEVRAAIRPETKLIWCESPTNPVPAWWSTTPSRRRTCRTRSRWARTSSCTRRRSTSAATPTSSAAR